jgi:putative glutamine amidotransferase
VSNDAAVIGISTGRIAVAGRVIDGTQHEYAERVTDAGGVAILLPVQPIGSLASILRLVDGLLLAGGGDVDPRRYGAQQAPESGGIDPDRDEAETFLVEEASRGDIPVVAICRGVQILNVARGGSLVQHLPSVTAEPHLVIERRTEAVHSIRVDPDSSLSRIVGKDRLETNSLHHQAVERLGRQLTAVAWAADGTIEAIEDRQCQMVGVQWHPEQMPDRPEQMRMFTWLVERALEHRRSRHSDPRHH